MPFGALTLNSPAVKGVAKVALGVTIAGMIVSLDAAGAFAQEESWKVTKYAGYTAGVYYVISGLSKIMVGE